MAFNKRKWIAREGVGLNKFRLGEGGEVVALINTPDVVSVEGDPLSAENLNDLERRIAEGFDTYRINRGIGQLVWGKHFSSVRSVVVSIQNGGVYVNGSLMYSGTPEALYVSLVIIGGGAGGGGGGATRTSGTGRLNKGGDGAIGNQSVTTVYLNSLPFTIKSDGGFAGLGSTSYDFLNGDKGGDSGIVYYSTSVNLPINECEPLMYDANGNLWIIPEVDKPSIGAGGKGSTSISVAGSNGQNGGAGGGGRGGNAGGYGDGGNGGDGGNQIYDRILLKIQVKNGDVVTINLPALGVGGSGGVVPSSGAGTNGTQGSGVSGGGAGSGASYTSSNKGSNGGAGSTPYFDSNEVLISV